MDRDQQSFDETEVSRLVDRAIRKFIDLDHRLLDLDANERTMTHELAEYLQQEFDGWNVDCEYNRHGDDEKTLPRPSDEDLAKEYWKDSNAKTIFPDIVVHKRETRQNLLAIEAKKSSNDSGAGWARAKLKVLKDEPYGYQYGMFLIFRVRNKGSTGIDVEYI